jgi:hypothetical protein
MGKMKTERDYSDNELVLTYFFNTSIPINATAWWAIYVL